MGEDDSADDAERARALVRVRALLIELGCTEDEVDEAVADDVVDLLMVDRLLVPSGRVLTQAEVSERTGIPIDVARRFWRALGFLDVADGDPVFTDMDVEAVELFQAMVAMDLVDLETAVQMARVIGSSMARIAEAEAAPGVTPILMGTGDSLIDADQFARRAGESIPAMARLLEYVWRRHLQVATRRSMMLRARGSVDGSSPVTAVGFADMVGFTMLSEQLGDEELAAVVSRFEEVAHDTVVALGGRVVKMIGDEAMFVVQSATGAAEIGLSLAEAYADDELLSDVRVGLALGPVLLQDGDFYGPVVNLASRLVGVANPGTVLVSDEFRSALGDEGAEGFETRALRSRTLKDFGRIQSWKLTRAGSDPGADRRRKRRWERLNEILRELDELRERGEHVVHGSQPSSEPPAALSTPDGVGASGASAPSAPSAPSAVPADGRGPDAPGPSVPGQPGGGDAVGPEVEPTLEGGDGPAPKVDQPT